jgi:uncharacterized protein YyaL (SSP411 family)
MLVPKPGKNVPGLSLLDRAASLFEKIYDPENGGMKGAPKFPSTLPVRFLLRQHLRTGNRACLDMAVTTLKKMAHGGMYDQIGGGFHRYSTDPAWLVPHFEKMLYDNALLAVAYLEGFQATGDDVFRKVSVDTLDYVKKEMTSPEGLFYSATDADSVNSQGEKEEGWFFTWAPGEVERVLGKDLASIALEFFSMNGEPHLDGRFIPHIQKDPGTFALEKGLSEMALSEMVETAKKNLYEERSKRKRPLTDTKIITSWNGLMISAFAKAGFVLDAPVYTATALRAASELASRVLLNGRLFRTWQDGQAKHRGCLDDHAFLEQAFLDLYESTFDPAWLERALEIDDILANYFEDKDDGGFFMTASNHESLIAREKPGHDNATPSGNSVQTLNLLRLYSLTGTPSYLKRAENTFRAMAASLESSPHAFGDMLLSLDFHYGSPKGIVVSAKEGAESETGEFLNVLRRVFLPNKVVVAVRSLEEKDRKSVV